MEIILKDSYDIFEEYAKKRPNVTEKDARDLVNIFIKFLKLKMQSNEHYAISTPLGIFYKNFDKKSFEKESPPTKKEDILNEKIFINSQIKKKIYKQYNYEDIELVKQNTNHSPIKN